MFKIKKLIETGHTVQLLNILLIKKLKSSRVNSISHIATRPCLINAWKAYNLISLYLGVSIFYFLIVAKLEIFCWVFVWWAGQKFKMYFIFKISYVVIIKRQYMSNRAIKTTIVV